MVLKALNHLFLPSPINSLTLPPPSQTFPQTPDMLQDFTNAFPLPGLLFPWGSTCLATSSCICLKVAFSVKPSLSPYFKSSPLFPYTHTQTHLHTHHSLFPFPTLFFHSIYHILPYSIIYSFCKMSVSICNPPPPCPEWNVNSMRAGIFVCFIHGCISRA